LGIGPNPQSPKFIILLLYLINIFNNYIMMENSDNKFRFLLEKRLKEVNLFILI